MVLLYFLLILATTIMYLAAWPSLSRSRKTSSSLALLLMWAGVSVLLFSESAMLGTVFLGLGSGVQLLDLVISRAYKNGVLWNWWLNRSAAK